jgi:hypothetical protein
MHLVSIDGHELADRVTQATRAMLIDRRSDARAGSPEVSSEQPSEPNIDQGARRREVQRELQHPLRDAAGHIQGRRRIAGEIEGQTSV